MVPDWIVAVGEGFGPGDYLIWSRIQGSLWTLAGYAIILGLLRLTNLSRTFLGRRRHVFSYLVLAGTVPFALMIPVAPTGGAFFRLELAVTVPHFLLILYLLAVNMGCAAKTLSRLVVTDRGEQTDGLG